MMLTMNRTWLIALLIAVSSMGAAICRADALGARMDVTATVQANCSLTVPPLSFGVYDPLSANATAPADATTVMVVTCTRNAGAAVAFDLGLHGLVGGERMMQGLGPEGLRYQIFRDSARSQVWGQGADGMSFISSGISSPEQFTVFGRILPRQEVEPGAYGDVLTATVDF